MSQSIETTLHTLGRLARAVYPNGDIPLSIHDVATVQPATAAGMLSRQAQQAPEHTQYDIERLLASLPADLSDPTDGVAEKHHMAYWMGWYSYLADMTRSWERGRRGLERAAVALYGADYVAPLSETLGVNKRKVREWRSGAAIIPAGIWPELAALLADRGQQLRSVLRDIELGL